jgi:hypothetical protein
MKEPACATCKLRRSYDRNPRSLIGRLWRWHATWCPGFKAYLRGLPEAERRAVSEAYGLARK